MRTRGLGLAVALVVALALGRAQPVHAAPTPGDPAAEYDPYSQAWNGMASFVGLAEGMGFEVVKVSSLQWEDVGPEDILFLIYPLQRVDPTKLNAFINAGGNVVIADDFGEARDAMQSLRMLRVEPANPVADRYYQNLPYAPIATARGDHPLTKDVGDVVTNHPAALKNVIGATTVIAFEEGAVVVAGEWGSGKFVAISDPSILINRMLQFPGNVTLARNLLDWLDRGHHARRVVLLRGDTQMFGDPRPRIYDANASELGRSIDSLNYWLSTAQAWLLTPGAMKALAAVLALLLLALALFALPIRRGPQIDGAWLRFGRPGRRDEPHHLIAAADTARGGGANLVLACVLRDQVQALLAETTGKPEPLYTVPEPQLVAELARAKGTEAGVALSRVYRRLRALPSRGQAAAPWSAGYLARRDFDALYKDVAELCRTLGSELPEVEA